MKPLLQRRRFEFYKEAYDRQLLRRSEAMDRLGILVTAYTILGGMLAFYANGFPSDRATVWAYLFYAFFIPGAVTAIVGVAMFAFQTQWGVQYKVLKPPRVYDEAFSRLEQAGPDSDALDAACVREFDDLLAAQLREAASHNQEANDLREKRANRILRIAAWAAILLIIAALPYLVAKHSERREPIEVTVQNPISINERR
jgi:hypothetical protein